MPNLCKECGANIDMVGIRHRCIPRAVKTYLGGDVTAPPKAQKPAPAPEPEPVPSPTPPPKKEKPVKKAAKKTAKAKPAKKAKAAKTAKAPKKAAPAAKTGTVREGSLESTKPWETEGISRRTYYRNKAKGK